MQYSQSKYICNQSGFRDKQKFLQMYIWEMMMNELVDLDEDRLRALEMIKRQKEMVSRAYNKKVKGKTFINNDLVWKVILPIDRKNQGFRKMVSTLGRTFSNLKSVFK